MIISASASSVRPPDLMRNLFQHHQSSLQHHAEELHKFLTEGVEKHATFMSKKRARVALEDGGDGGAATAATADSVDSPYAEPAHESWTAHQWQQNFTDWRKCVLRFCVFAFCDFV